MRPTLPALAWICSVLACSQGELSRLVLEVRNIPEDSTQLQVALKYAGLDPAITTFQPTTPLVVDLPDNGKGGELTISLDALNAASCPVASASVSARPPLAPAYTLTLAPVQGGTCAGPAGCSPGTLCLLSSAAPVFTAVWGTARDLWGVGAAGLAAHFDGFAWTQFDSKVADDLTAVWGSTSSNVWAVGNHGRIAHFGGSEWFGMDSGYTKPLRSIFGTSPFDIWACGDSPTAGGVGIVLHFDGRGWSPSNNTTGGSLFSIVARDGVAWAFGEAGLLLTGTLGNLKAAASPSSYNLRASAVTPAAVFFGGDGSQIFEATGGLYRALPTTVPAGVLGLAAAADGRLAVSDGSASLMLYAPPYDHAMILATPGPVRHVESTPDGHFLVGGGAWIGYAD